MTGGGAAVAIREALDPDLLATLEALAFPDPWPRSALEPLFGAGAAAAWVAIAPSGEPVGFALFQLLPGESELLRVGVVPAARRSGVGRALLGAALAELSAGGREVCHLEVRAGNRAARSLYEGLDFVVVGLRRGYYGDGEDAVRYRRPDPAPSRGAPSGRVLS